MHFDDSRPQDEAVDGVMGAIYQQLDEHVSDTDVPYDIEAGLDRLTDRMHLGLGEARLPVAAAASGSSLAKSDQVLLAEIEAREHAISRDAELRLARSNDRRGYVVFGGIVVLALASVALLALGRLPSTAAISAVTVVNAVAAAAGAFIQRGAVAVRQRAAASLRPERSSARQYRGDPEGQGNVTLRIEHMSGGSIEMGRASPAVTAIPGPLAFTTGR